MSGYSQLTQDINDSYAMNQDPTLANQLKRTKRPSDLARAILPLISNEFTTNDLLRNKAQSLLEILEDCFLKLEVCEVLKICNGSKEVKNSVDWAACKSFRKREIPVEYVAGVEALAIRFLSRQTASRKRTDSARRNLASYEVLQKIGTEKALEALIELRRKYGDMSKLGKCALTQHVEVLDDAIADIPARMKGLPLPSAKKKLNKLSAKDEKEIQALKESKQPNELWEMIVGNNARVGSLAAKAIERFAHKPTLEALVQKCEDIDHRTLMPLTRCVKRIGDNCSPEFVLVIFKALVEKHVSASSSMPLVRVILRECSKSSWAKEFALTLRGRPTFKTALSGLSEDEKKALPPEVSSMIR